MVRKGNLAVFESSNIFETGDISTPSLISACFFTVGIQAQPLRYSEFRNCQYYKMTFNFPV